MSEKELLKALEEDARRECNAILENAQKEAEDIIKGAEEDMERLKIERLEGLKASVDEEKIKILSGARLYANEVMLKEKEMIIKMVLETVNNRFKELPKSKDYPHVIKTLFKEAADEWHIVMESDTKKEKAVVVISKEGIPILKGFNDTHDYEIIPDETGNMSPGVIIMDRDKRFRIVNTLESRLEKARSKIVSMIDSALFDEIPKSQCLISSEISND